MRLGVLFSGGKDSCAATTYAKEHDHEVSCLLAIISENLESYLFHTPNINKTALQAKAMGIPLLTQQTKGVQDEELYDLLILLKSAKEQYHIEGIVTGAINSVYQATRIQKICAEIGLWCFNPLWQRDPLLHVATLIQQGFEMRISAVAAYPLDESWLGRKIDRKGFFALKKVYEEHNINPAGEGGEYESFVSYAPYWKEEIEITKATNKYEHYAGTYTIENATTKPREWTKKHTSIEPTKKSTSTNTLLVSTCKEKFSEMEFVQPIAQLLDCACTTINYKKLTKEHLEKNVRVIICGTALADDEFLDHLDMFSWLHTFNKPVLGICAGFQIMKLVDKNNVKQNKIVHNQEIGMCSLKKNPWDIKEAYFLHHNSVSDEKGELIEAFFHDTKNKRFGVLFHPEVRNEKIIQEFLKET